MSLPSKAYIVADGVVSPLGENASTTALAIQAGLSAFGSVDYYDEDYNPLTMATVPASLIQAGVQEALHTQAESARFVRLLAMAGLALGQVKPALPEGVQPPLFLATSEIGPIHKEAIPPRFLSLLAAYTQLPLDIGTSRMFHTGRAGAFDALRVAMEYLQLGLSPYVLVGGVDTAFDLHTLQGYIGQQRLNIAGSLNGFIPGEAAAFLLLTAASPASPEQPFVCAPGLDFETGHIYSDQPCLGNGLSKAVQATLQHYSGERIATILSSMNGETYFGKELGVMMLRNRNGFTEDVAIQHPADCVGDTGAAAGVLMMSFHYQNLITQYATAPGLVCCSSDQAYRGATVVACERA